MRNEIAIICLVCRYKVFIASFAIDFDTAKSILEGELPSSPAESIESVIPEPEAPWIKVQFDGAEAEEGAVGTLTCQIGGWPLPQVTWLKDGHVIEPSDKFKFCKDGENYTMLIKKLTAEDGGQYTVRVKNDLGSTEASGQLLVKAAPKILSELPKETSATEGEPLKLSAQVSPGSDVQWLKDGVPIAPDDARCRQTQKPDGTVELVIDKAKPGDSAKYSLVSSNPMGSAESSTKADVTPIKAPSIVQGLPDIVSAKEGEPLKLTAKVDGDQPEIQWLKDGKPIDPNTPGVTMNQKPDGTVELIIEKAKPEDSGKYGLVVSGAGGSAESSTKADVTPTKAPSIVQELPDSVTANEGEHLKLTAKVDGDNPEVQWMKDGKPIDAKTQGVTTIQKPDGTVELVIEKAKPEDSGKYGLVVSSPHGTAESSTKADVTPAKAPSIVQGLPESVTAKEGEQIKLTAKIEGADSVQWLRDGKPISPDEAAVTMATKPDGTYELTISKAKPKDSATYQIVAKNANGQTESASAVSVQPKPKKPSLKQELAPSNVNLVEGQQLKLKAVVTSGSGAEVKWKRDGQVLEAGGPVSVAKTTNSKGDDVYTLTVDGVAIDQGGKYEFVAKNAAGQVTSDSMVNVSPKVLKTTVKLRF